MKEIKLRKLELSYFKGAKCLTIDDITDDFTISADNGKFKTTIKDAVSWLLFGKDSQGATSFGIKTLNDDNSEIERVDHSVYAELEVDGKQLKLKRTFREKWVKKRGELEETFQGNETKYNFDEIEVNESQYKANISSIIEESVFMLITDVYRFNKIDDDKKRAFLINLAGEVSLDEVLSKLKKETRDESILQKYEELVVDLRNSKKIEDLKKKHNSVVKRCKDELDLQPPRIDEQNKVIAQYSDINFEEIEKNINDKKEQLSQIDSQISDKTKSQQALLLNNTQINSKVSVLNQKLNELRNKADIEEQNRVNNANKLYDDAHKELSMFDEKAKNITTNITNLKSFLDNQNNTLLDLNNQISDLRNRYESESQKNFVSSSDVCICPLTKANCTDENTLSIFKTQQQSLVENFNKEKAEKLSAINKDGLDIKTRIEGVKNQIASLEQKITTETNEYNELINQKSKIQEKYKDFTKESLKPINYEKDIADYSIILNEIKLLNSQIVTTFDDDKTLIDKRRSLSEEIEYLNKELNKKELIENSYKRIEEIKSNIKSLATEQLKAEKDEYVVSEFNKCFMSEVEKRVNDKFSLVKFKLFEKQINGGEKPCCIALINGVPYSDANTASKINAGIDIINTLSDFYGVKAPVIIDNCESINELMPSKSQRICLRVSKDKELVFERK